MEDETGYSFPESVNIIAMPKQVSLRDDNIDYRAAYTRHGNVVIAQRHLTFRHEGIVCTAGDYQRLQPMLDRIMRDLKSQVIVGAQ
jgi:hypothetical protein